MGKRSAVVELFLGDMGSMQRELRPSIQREDQPTMETKLEQIAVKAVNQLPKSVVREIRTPRSVGAGGGRPPPATRWARRNPRPYRDHLALQGRTIVEAEVADIYPACLIGSRAVALMGNTHATHWPTDSRQPQCRKGNAIPDAKL